MRTPQLALLIALVGVAPLHSRLIAEEAPAAVNRSVIAEGISSNPGAVDIRTGGFDDEFQYIDFKLPWEDRKAIKCFPDFEREFALKACEAWQNKKDRHPY